VTAFIFVSCSLNPDAQQTFAAAKADHDQYDDDGRNDNP